MKRGRVRIVMKRIEENGNGVKNRKTTMWQEAAEKMKRQGRGSIKGERERAVEAR